MKSRQITRRMNVRVRVRIPATVEFPPGAGNPLHAVTRDMSFDGAFLRHDGPAPEKGIVARVSLHSPPWDPLVIDALVLRSDDRGVGVMFGHYANAVFDRLASLMEPELDRYIVVPKRAHGTLR